MARYTRGLANAMFQNQMDRITKVQVAPKSLCALSTENAGETMRQKGFIDKKPTGMMTGAVIVNSGNVSACRNAIETLPEDSPEYGNVSGALVEAMISAKVMAPNYRRNSRSNPRTDAKRELAIYEAKVLADNTKVFTQKFPSYNSGIGPVSVPTMTSGQIASLYLNGGYNTSKESLLCLLDLNKDLERFCGESVLDFAKGGVVDTGFKAEVIDSARMKVEKDYETGEWDFKVPYKEKVQLPTQLGDLKKILIDEVANNELATVNQLPAVVVEGLDIQEGFVSEEQKPLMVAVIKAGITDQDLNQLYAVMDPTKSYNKFDDTARVAAYTEKGACYTKPLNKALIAEALTSAYLENGVEPTTLEMGDAVNKASNKCLVEGEISEGYGRTPKAFESYALLNARGRDTHEVEVRVITGKGNIPATNCALYFDHGFNFEYKIRVEGDVCGFTRVTDGPKGKRIVKVNYLKLSTDLKGIGTVIIVPDIERCDFGEVDKDLINDFLYELPLAIKEITDALDKDGTIILDAIDEEVTFLEYKVIAGVAVVVTFELPTL